MLYLMHSLSRVKCFLLDHRMKKMPIQLLLELLSDMLLHHLVTRREYKWPPSFHLKHTTTCFSHMYIKVLEEVITISNHLTLDTQ